MKKTKDKTSEAIKAQDHKRVVAEQAAKKQGKEILSAVKASSKKQVEATNKMTKSLQGTIKSLPAPATAMEIAEAMAMIMAAHEQSKPQPKKFGVGLIAGVVAIIIALLIAVCWIVAVIVGREVRNKATESQAAAEQVQQIKQEMVSMQDAFRAELQKDRKEFIVTVGGVVNDKVDARSREASETIKNIVVKEVSGVQTAINDQNDRIAALIRVSEIQVAASEKTQKEINSLKASLELANRENGDLKQTAEFQKEQIAALMNRSDSSVVKAETPKQPDVHVPVTVTVNTPSRQEPVAQASASVSTTSSYSNDTEAKAPVNVESKKWSGNASVGFKSDGLERDGTIHPGSVIEAKAKVFVTDRLSVNASVAESSNVLSKKIGLGVGYELFPYLTVGLSGEKRDRDNRAILSIDFEKEVWAGKYGDLSVLGDVEVSKIFGAEPNVNKVDHSSGVEAFLGVNYSLEYLSWSTLSLETGLAYNSGGTVSRGSLFVPGKKFFYGQDSGFALDLKLSNEFRISKRWTFTPSVMFVKTLNDRNFLGDVVTPGDLPKKTNVMFGAEFGFKF